MPRPTHGSECSAAAALYVAVEVSPREWLLTLSPGGGVAPQRARVVAGDVPALERAWAAARRRWGLGAAVPVRSCYEAGRDGFWPHRLLTQLGVVNVVVDSSSIEVSRRARRAKTDRLDGARLLRMLLRHWGGERGLWHVVQVPPPAQEDARHASRALTTALADRTRYRNRLHALAALHGVRRLRVDARLPERLETLRDWAGAPLPAGVRARMLLTWRVLQTIETEVRAARRQERAAARVPAAAPPTMVQRLTQLRGVGARSATILSEELFSRRLRNRREVGALAGLVSAPYASGDRTHDQGVTRGGLPAVRRIAVELAWAWLRYQPSSALTQWYQARFAGGGPGTRRLGIVAVARRLVVALWRYVDQGVVPAGAQLTR